MADRTLTWYISGQMSENVVGTNVSAEYTLDKDYTPSRAIVRLNTAGDDDDGGSLTIDINDDGTSIFDLNPCLTSGMTGQEFAGFDDALTKMLKDSVITLDVDSICQDTAGAGLTVELDLVEA